jgi:hypothetical protein
MTNKTICDNCTRDIKQTEPYYRFRRDAGITIQFLDFCCESCIIEYFQKKLKESAERLVG